MVFVLFCCRRHHKLSSKKVTVSHMFALKIFSWRRVLWCWCSRIVALMFLRPMAKLRCLVDCQVTNRNHTKCFTVLTAWVFLVHQKGWICCIKALSWQRSYGCMFPGSSCCTWTVTNGNILYLILLLLMGGDATHSF